jgi:orotidine-5'-phosphate decarboxylase
MAEKEYRIIPALDTTDLDVALRLVCRTAGSKSVYGYKLGFALGLSHGLPETVRRIREWTDKPLIYDHQKAATDIPDTGGLFGDVMKMAGITEVILFPHTGPRTLEAWVQAMQERGLKTIVGAVMTHPAYLVSEGGFIADEAAAAIYKQAAGLGVGAFVTPLTKPEVVAKLAAEVPFTAEQEFYSPGFGAQGGDPGQFPALKRHYLIIGRSLMAAEDPAKKLAEVEEELGIGM